MARQFGLGPLGAQDITKDFATREDAFGFAATMRHKYKTIEIYKSLDGRTAEWWCDCLRSPMYRGLPPGVFYDDGTCTRKLTEKELGPEVVALWAGRDA